MNDERPSPSKNDAFEDPIDTFLSEADEPIAPPVHGLSDALAAPWALSTMLGRVWQHELLQRHIESIALVTGVVALALSVGWLGRPSRPVVPGPAVSEVPRASLTPSVTPPAGPPTQVVASSRVQPAVAANRPTQVTTTSREEVPLGAEPLRREPPRAERDLSTAGASAPEAISSEEAAATVEAVALPLLRTDGEARPIAELATPESIVSRPMPVESSIVDRLSGDRAAIQGVLAAYQQSYRALDAETASTIWQGLDVRALRRAFSTLSSQDVSFETCEVDVAADRARASCTGVLSYVRKVGAGDNHQRRLSWTIDLRRTGDRWLIGGVSAQ